MVLSGERTDTELQPLEIWEPREVFLRRHLHGGWREEGGQWGLRDWPSEPVPSSQVSTGHRENCGFSLMSSA